ncbi:MAG: hypothetical protein HYZ44_02800 [Bacteroidetes bacterium]|nr:hypothetical protein [Bacteroidota bacterium]
MQLQTSNPWNSLEVVKLLVAGLIPLILVVIGLFLNKMLKRFEHRQWRNQKLIEKRLSVYDDIAPLLNDLLCYYTYVGSWKDFTPHEIIQKKRVVDKKIHIAAPLFSSSLFTEVMTFINLCFKPFQGWGHDAKLLTDIQRRKEVFGDKWEKNWNALFITNNIEVTEPQKIKESYLKIMKVFSEDIGLGEYN